MANVRKIILHALLRVEEDEGYPIWFWIMHCRMPDWIHEIPPLPPALFYGVLERRLTLDHIISHYSQTSLDRLTSIVRTSLRMGVYQLAFMDKIPPSAAVNESVKLVKYSRENKASGYVNGVLRALAREQGRLYDEHDLTVRYSAPAGMVKHFLHYYGPDLTEQYFMHSFGRPPYYLRVNSCKTDAAVLQ